MHSVSLAGNSKCSDCVCDPGSTLTSTNGFVRCRVNTYSLGDTPCVNCPTGAISPAGSASDAACVCLPGLVHTGAASSSGTGSACEACAAGKRSADNICVACDAGTESLPGASRCEICAAWDTGMVHGVKAVLQRTGVTSDSDADTLDVVVEHHVREQFRRAEISAGCETLYQMVLQRRTVDVKASRGATHTAGASRLAACGMLAASAVAFAVHGGVCV